MLNYSKVLILIVIGTLLSACSFKKPDPKLADDIFTPANQKVKLPAPYETKSTRTYCKIIGWAKGEKPTAPAGFTVNEYAGNMDNPRNIYIANNGDVFVSQANTEIKGIKKFGADLIGASASQDLNKSANNIILFRDTNGDGVADTKNIFLSSLNQPYGMLILGNWFYVANTDGLWRFPYKPGDTKITAPGTMILSLPAGGYNNHWTRNLRASKDGSKIFISVGSGTNDQEQGPENEKRRADVLEIDSDGKNEKIYASGLRNPVGIDLEPTTNTLWAAVNERDDLGDNLVPDYLTSVQQGGFYGWPWSYYGHHVDPTHVGEHPEMVKKAIVPDLALGSHTASLGLAFYTGKTFPAKYLDGAFIGQHGSWNSSKLVGYKVTFVPFVKGKCAGTMENFLTGFIADEDKREVHGRPVSIAVMHDGAILVADDSGNKIWRVAVN